MTYVPPVQLKAYNYISTYITFVHTVHVHCSTNIVCSNKMYLSYLVHVALSCNTPVVLHMLL